MSAGSLPYDQATQQGFLRHLVFREGRNTGQALIVLVTAPGELPEESFVRAMTRFPQVKSVYWGINDRPSEVTNVPSRLLWGEDAIEEELCGLRFRVRPNAFLQTNTAMAERLYELAIEYAGLEGGETVYDLYCGTGTIGLVMAKSAMTVWGVEASEESVACAIENAELNGIGNAAFFAGEVGRSVEELRERAGAAGRRRRRPAAGRALGEGSATGRPPRGAAPRLRVVQPDDARRQRQAAGRGVGLFARPRAAGGHVPAHAARRDRGSACADFGRAVGSKLVNPRRAGMARKFVHAARHRELRDARIRVRGLRRR